MLPAQLAIQDQLYIRSSIIAESKSVLKTLVMFMFKRRCSSFVTLIHGHFSIIVDFISRGAWELKKN